MNGHLVTRLRSRSSSSRLVYTSSISLPGAPVEPKTCNTRHEHGLVCQKCIVAAEMPKICSMSSGGSSVILFRVCERRRLRMPDRKTVCAAGSGTLTRYPILGMGWDVIIGMGSDIIRYRCQVRGSALPVCTHSGLVVDMWRRSVNQPMAKFHICCVKMHLDQHLREVLVILRS